MNKGAAVLSAFVAVMLATVSAYDFNDKYFNQYLASELQDSYSPKHYIRNRREVEDDEKCLRRFGPPMCCGRELHHNLIDKDIKRQCFAEVLGIKDDMPRGPPPDPFNCDKPHQRRNEMTCIFQCIGQKQNLIDENGEMKETEMRDFIKNSFSKASWIKPKEDEIIDKCIAETKAKVNDMKMNSTGKDNCSPVVMIFSHCLFREVQMNCPDEEIEDKKMCDRIREDITKYGDFPPPPPPGRPMNQD